MQRTTPGVRTDPSARVAELGRQRPEWEAWLGLLDEIERHESRAKGRGSRAASRRSRAGRGSEVGIRTAPVLEGRTIEVDAGELQRLIHRLAAKASDVEGGGSLRGYKPSREEALESVAAAVRQDQDAITAVAGARGLDAGALASVIHLAALPLLRAWGRELQGEIPEHWPHGYCPVCAAWPLLAERRGLDRSRWLRCGRCASGWEREWLLCVYCGELDHQRLGSLVLEDGSDTLKVETCAGCKGYLKSFATLMAIPPFELLLKDLETVELDLVALDRGYGKPAGVRLEVEMV
jgi:FdhE protein